MNDFSRKLVNIERMNYSNFVRLLSKSDQIEYNKLLKASFSGAKNFRTESATQVWTKTDDFYPVFGLFHGQKLVSIMRAEWIDSQLELMHKLGEPEGTWNPRLPMGYLAKAATLPEFAGKGFNSVLRYYCLKLYTHWRLEGVVGIMAAGSSRMNVMEKMGYKFRTKSGKWNGNFKSDHPILVGYLETSEEILKAILYLENNFSSIIQHYPISSEDLLLPKKGRCEHKFPWRT